ncbi:molybdopterin-dependent oxidoreductase [Leisingera sp. M527]|uniref:nitrate reductase n=1 Tax=Leisingera sp. M527 TaxID=2867014 RepID=UPI0021A942B0|nr:nitrate reductase [Leisingera sp. M527]UWQ33522.1 molybdopterin-dependent oxidoreductase [Leisingera sp. M527]
MAGAGCKETHSTCPYCGTGCGVLLRPDGMGGLTVRGDPDHPANRGRLCSKGLALGETVVPEGRLLAPRVNGQDTDWDSALDLVAAKFRQAVEKHGPDSVGFYLSGQMLTEDYYVANKLMKGFLGSANIDTNSRLCMASTVAGHKRAFGSDTVPGTYDDLEEADLIVLVGSNLAWCHPVLHQRILAAREARGTKLVVIDPRRTASCDQADMHLNLRAGSDVALFNRLLVALHEGGALDAGYLRNVNGLDEALDAAIADDASVTGLSEAEIAGFCNLWMRTEKVVTIFSQGVNQSTSGTDKVNAILNCHLAAGRIGKPGSGPFSVTGQPNAMGGREVGGLANMLACHMDLENENHRAAVQEFWGAPAMPDRAGLKAVDLFRAAGDGRLKALWIIHTNPAVTMPEADAVSAAIKACDFTVVSDITAATDTARLADVLLPAAAWAEKDGTVTNSDRTISRQRAVLPPPGQARADWDILADAGRRIGWGAAFGYQTPAEIFREHAALSGLAGSFGLDFDISGLAAISGEDYDDLLPQRWPVNRSRQGGRFFADGQFFHPDGKARMLPVRCCPPAAAQSRRYPFRLNSGRIRDQWHTMTRTALAPRLSGHLAEPFADIHPQDARALGVKPADLLRLSSPHGQAILRARITADVQPGDLFVPIHWTGETAPAARIDRLVAAAVDPVSGQPESKATVVAAERWQPAWYGFAVSRLPMTPLADYWAMARTKAGYRAELAGLASLAEPEAAARDLFALPEAEVQMMTDRCKGIARLALIQDGKVMAALFTAPEPVAVSRDYLAGLPGTGAAGVLTGRPAADQPDPGPVVCACFSVGANTILHAIEYGGLMSVADIGAALQAGTNCGSCRPDIADLLARRPIRQAAEQDGSE